MNKEMSFVLPYPHKASTNRVWQRKGNIVYVSPEVKAYRERVYYALHGSLWMTHSTFYPSEALRMEIKMYPPDKRKRDIDNILKSTLDALEHAGLYDDDFQIKELYVEKLEAKKDGMLVIKVNSLT